MVKSLAQFTSDDVGSSNHYDSQRRVNQKTREDF